MDLRALSKMVGMTRPTVTQMVRLRVLITSHFDVRYARTRGDKHQIATDFTDGLVKCLLGVENAPYEETKA